MKGLILGVLVLAVLNVPVFALDNSQDILKDQETVISDNIIDTGVLNVDWQTIKIDTTINQIII